MRKLAILMAAALAIGIAAIAYAQAPVENTYKVAGSTSPTNAGSTSDPVNVRLSFNYEVGEVQNRRPSPIKTYDIHFAGMIANTRDFPACTASKIEADGPNFSPAGSEVGSGFIENATGANNNPSDQSVECNAALTVFNGGAGKATIYVAGDPNQSDPRRKCAIALAAPIPARFVKNSRGTSLRFSVPQSLLHPAATLTNAVKKVTSTINNKRRRGKAFFQSVGGCRNNRRRMTVTFTPEQGARKVVIATARCRS